VKYPGKVRAKFLAQFVLRVVLSGMLIMSEVARAIDGGRRVKSRENRFSYNLQRCVFEDLERIDLASLRSWWRRGMLLIVDISDIRKQNFNTKKKRRRKFKAMCEICVAEIKSKNFALRDFECFVMKR